MLAHLGPRDMRIAISYALHGGESVALADRQAGDRGSGNGGSAEPGAVVPLDLAQVGVADVRAGRRRGVSVPAPRARSRAGGRHRALRPERGQRGRGARVPARRARLQRDRGHDRAHAAAAGRPAAARVRVAVRGRPSRASGGKRAAWLPNCKHELVLDDPRDRPADHPARARSLPGRQGGRDAGGALLAVLPADARARAQGRDRVRDRRDPGGRLREDHRHEPRGDRRTRARGGATRLLQPGAVEARRRDPRRPGREPADRVRAVLGDHRDRATSTATRCSPASIRRSQRVVSTTGVGAVEPGMPADRRPQTGRPHPAGRRQTDDRPRPRSVRSARTAAPGRRPMVAGRPRRSSSRSDAAHAR